MKLLKYIILTYAFGFLCGCNKLDIPPTNIIQDDAVFTDAGMRAYMASLYSRLPIEDFKYSATEGDGFNTWNGIWVPMLNTGENANRNTNGFQNPARGYWKSGYQVIRNANYLIENLPAYAATLNQERVDRWIAEARFIRAFVYFALAKRYGGVPIVDQVQNIVDGDIAPLQVPRNSEQEVYDFILADLDYAAEYMQDESEQEGRANRNVALAFKSRVALSAGSIARYGTPYIVEGVMLTGIPASAANDYFLQSFQAAKQLEGKYELYMRGWSATDKIATADNYANLFLVVQSGKHFYQSIRVPQCVPQLRCRICTSAYDDHLWRSVQPYAGLRGAV